MRRLKVISKFLRCFAVFAAVSAVGITAYAAKGDTKVTWFDENEQIRVIKDITYNKGEGKDVISVNGQNLARPDVIYKNLPSRYEVRFHADYPDKKYVSETFEGNFTEKVTYFQEKQEIFKVTIQFKGEADYRVTETKTGYAIEIIKGKIREDISALAEVKEPEAGKTYNFEGKTVVLDPGHGGYDPGAVGYLPDGTKVNEKDLNLNIALKVDKLLKSAGIKVEMTRRTDMFVGLLERAEIANDMNAAMFVSIHNNASDNKDASGTLTVYTPERGASNLSSYELAVILQGEMVKTIGLKDRGFLKSPKMVVLKNTKMVSAITESAFLSNAEDLAKLTTEEFKQKIAKGIANGIIKALEKDAEIE